MSELNRKSPESLQDRLEQVVCLLEHEVAGEESLDQRGSLDELQLKLEELHPADVAYILESLPLDQRLTVWQLVKSDRDGEILLEVSDAVRETLIADMDSHEIIAAANTLDADELADLAPDLPRDVVRELMDTLDAQQRERLKSALSYDDDQVGSLMDFDMVTIRDDVTLEVVSRYLRRFEILPDHTDKLFVVDTEGVLKGVLPVKKLLVSSPDELVGDVMSDDPVVFNPLDDAGEAAQAFERYDLISAPVVDEQGKLFGRLTIDEMVDYIREESEAEVLNAAGLREEEDIFASVWKSVRNRWAWLAINLCTALIASRVIGLFEGAIEQLVALAALMPIVAGVGGNSGNQTITMIVRGLATGQVQAAHGKRLIRKEMGVALINGLFWGLVLALIAYALYGNAALSLVLLAAMTLNMLLAAFMGVVIPLARVSMGGDPALGSSVMITAITDSGGFFIFLGMATIFLL
ncbi:magnesium transporter [Halopseudomonas xinjiangensis]|uniref:Magnesium transporter MgtE n=1 Tax=Halopseudomonas xinjiangensis TaxID=487184 RepID=A0A1H1U750_9GAMM|nr:magnesium transporter [Halopseudomonas xinjiangensis]SDS68171.1 magnesium transporter [Halopseudomonas xinjiangensis]